MVGKYLTAFHFASLSYLASYSRFLIKELLLPRSIKSQELGDPRASHDPPRAVAPQTKAEPVKEAGGYGYRWQYIAFVTLWFMPKKSDASQAGNTTTNRQRAKLAVLCFDQSPIMKSMLTDSFMRSSLSTFQHCPYGVYEILLSTIFTYYDWALWDFQKPVRDMEKVIFLGALEVFPLANHCSLAKISFLRTPTIEWIW